LGIVLQAQAGTIGRTNENWSHREKVTSMPAARRYLAAGVSNGGQNGFFKLVYIGYRVFLKEGVSCH